jgi:hypothetical protein
LIVENFGCGERIEPLTSRFAAQPFDHRSARRIGEGMEEAVKIGRLVKHALKYHDENR